MKKLMSEDTLIDIIKKTCMSWAVEEFELNKNDTSSHNVPLRQRYGEQLKAVQSRLHTY